MSLPSDLYYPATLSALHIVNCLRAHAALLRISPSTFAAQRLAAWLHDANRQNKLPHLVACIVLLHRSLDFSTDIFLDSILHTYRQNYANPSALLLTLHALVSRLSGLISLDMVVERLETDDFDWVVNGLKRLLVNDMDETEQSLRVFDDYLMSMILTISFMVPSSSPINHTTITVDAAKRHSKSWSLYVALTRDDVQNFLNWRSEHPNFPTYSRIFAILSAPIHAPHALDARDYKIFVMKELSRLCTMHYDPRVHHQPEERALDAENLGSNVLEKVMMAGRALFENNDDALRCREGVLRPLIDCVASTCDPEAEGSTSAKPTVAKYVIEQLRKNEPNLHPLTLLALFRLSCRDTSILSSPTLRTGITTEICALLEQGLADSTDHVAITLGIVLAQIAGRERALFPETADKADKSDTVSEGRDDEAGYHAWFLNTFVDEKTSLLKSKRTLQSFVGSLQEMVPFEAPAVLQLQGKAVQGIQKYKLIVSEYTTLVKTRLMDLGLDHTLRKNPISLSIPTNIRTSDGLQIPTATSAAFTSMADITTILSLFAQTGRVPTSLGQDSVFRQRWYNNTFLPALLFDDHDRQMPLLPKEAVAKYDEARHGLVAALHELKKVPPKLYAQYLERRKGSGGSGGSGGGGERDGMVWLGQQKENEHFGQRSAVKENIGATESNAMEVKRQLLKKLGGLRKAGVT